MVSLDYGVAHMSVYQDSESQLPPPVGLSFGIFLRGSRRSVERLALLSRFSLDRWAKSSDALLVDLHAAPALLVLCNALGFDTNAGPDVQMMRQPNPCPPC